MVLARDLSVADVTLAPPVVAKSSLAGLGRAGLRAALADAGVPEKQLRMRVSQMYSWLYVRGASSFDTMTDVAKELREALAERYTLARPEIVSEQVSVDGTRKWLLRLPAQGRDGKPPEIETVYIPEAERGTLCISSQVGCTLNCTFCHTGTQRLVRNLTAQEIVGQILLARDRIGDWVLPKAGKTEEAIPPGDGRLLPAGDRKITNIVLMGMGEPLYNFDNVKAAMESPPTARRCRYRSGGSPCRRQASFPRSPAGAPRPALASPSRCMPCAMSCAMSWCRSIASIRSPSCWRHAAIIRRFPTRGASPSNT